MLRFAMNPVSKDSLQLEVLRCEMSDALQKKTQHVTSPSKTVPLHCSKHACYFGGVTCDAPDTQPAISVRSTSCSCTAMITQIVKGVELEGGLP